MKTSTVRPLSLHCPGRLLFQAIVVVAAEWPLAVLVHPLRRIVTAFDAAPVSCALQTAFPGVGVDSGEHRRRDAVLR